MLKKGLFETIALFSLSFFIFGCTSVPEIDRAYAIEDSLGMKKYDVEIDSDYMGKPEEFKYAINSFVKEQGGTSYNIEKHGENNFFVTIPGKTPVENLPKVKHFHVGRTIGLILPPAILGSLLLFFIFPSII